MLGNLRRIKLTSRIVIGVFAIAILLAAVLGASFFAGEDSSAVDPRISKIWITITAEGADGNATPAEVVVDEVDRGSRVLETKALANIRVDLGDLGEGSYLLYVVQPPVAPDGSTYKLPEEPVAFSVDGSGDDVGLSVELERLALEDMSKEQLEASAAALEQSGNFEAAQHAREAASSAQSVVGSASAVQHSTSNSEPESSNSVPSPGLSDAAPSGGGTQAHTHTWVPQTEQQWVSNNVWVVDQAAWDEQVTTYEWHEVCSCGYDCTANGVNPADHTKDHGRGWSGSVSTQQVPVTTTVHHDEVGHWDDQGHYETVTTGYVCSCGAVK